MSAKSLDLDTTRLRNILRHCWPQAHRGAGPTSIEAWSEPLGDTIQRYGIAETPARLKHFLGQVGHESGQGRYREELASGRSYEGREDLGNEHPGDGPRFKGRGLIQLTGRANYTAYNHVLATRDIMIDVVQDPEAVATTPFLCCDVAGWFWQGKKLNEYADRPDWSETETCRQITRKINGGFNGLNDRLYLTRLAREAIKREFSA